MSFHRIVCGSMAALCTTATLAQQPAASGGALLEEVIVTAQKRTENLQSVPIAVSTLSAQDLAKSGMSTVQDLNEVIAGLNIQRSGQDAQIKLRGIGTENQGVGDEANVAVYVDGVYQPINKGDNFRFVDIERVEVLKGPQGTLFGRNATGGLINIITRTPSLTEARGDLTLSYSRFDTKELNGYLSAPIGETLAGGIAAFYARSDGYLTDPNHPGVDISPNEAYAVRGKLLWQPSERARIVLAMDAGFLSDPSPYQPTIVDDSSAFAVLEGPPPFSLSDRKFETTTNFIPRNKTKDFGGSLQATVNFDKFDLISITGARHATNDAKPDADITPFDAAYITFLGDRRSASEDLRLQSSDAASRLQWTAGVFAYWAQDSWDDFTLHLGPFAGGPALGYIIQPEVETLAFAAYGQAAYSITDRWTAVLGVRYSDEHKEDKVTAAQTGVFFPYPTVEGEANFDDFSPKVTLQYNLSADTMVYASYGRGFKSGLLNPLEVQNTENDGVTPRPQDAAKVIQPEKIKAAEIGVKTDLTQNLRANISAFHYEYTNLQNQFVIPNSSGNKIENIGEATVKGVDADLLAAFSGVLSSDDRLDLKVALSYLDGKYDSYPNASVYVYDGPGRGLRASSIDAGGNRITRTPEWTESLTADYSKQTAAGNFGLSVNFFHSADFFYDPANTPRFAHPAYTKVNLALNWRSPDESTTVSLWGKNITDETTFQQTYTIAPALAKRYYAPATYGLTVGYHF